MNSTTITPGTAVTRPVGASETATRRAAGWAGVAVGGVSVLMVALYFVYSGPPPESNVLTRGLLTLGIMAALTFFGIGVARLLPTGPNGERSLAGQLSIVSLFTYVAVILFATSLEVGTPLAFPGKSMDPTTDGPLAAAMALAHGPIAHLWVAMFFLGFAKAVSRPVNAPIVPAWTIGGSVVLAVINLLAIPSLYFGMNAANFYAVNGWGADALVGLITLVWVGFIGLGILRGHKTRAA
ncbi:hypothetical protein [Fodinicola acaciae]|uniref:hypothetical protein n=1 Tax=Fodinicola acaciae TaxID=2681555 RepID=UPI001FE9DE79|nr:hypothetical protein [Fodinicola acaciae]